MTVPAILLPVFVLVLLTFVLLGAMGSSRRAALHAREVRMDDIALGQGNWPVQPTKFGRAYQNQFELPMLFYVLVAFALYTRKADLLFVVLEWLFVLSRLVHAAIHVSSNRVPLRFAAFVFGMVVLALMWLIFAVRILAAF